MKKFNERFNTYTKSDNHTNRHYCIDCDQQIFEEPHSDYQ